MEQTVSKPNKGADIHKVVQSYNYSPSDRMAHLCFFFYIQPSPQESQSKKATTEEVLQKVDKEDKVEALQIFLNSH